MGLAVCPSAIVRAPVEVVWDNLVLWERYAEWADVQVERTEPPGPARVSQVISFRGKAVGRTWHLAFSVEQLNAEAHALGVHVVLPFGLQQTAHISCTAIDATTCRVHYG